MRAFLAAIIIAFHAPAALAEAQQQNVLSCFAGMGETTDWPTCLNTMFAPCEGHAVGSDGHLSCLSDQRLSWQTAKRGVEADVLAALSETGIEELSGLMLAWPEFVNDKCAIVAERRAAISHDAALLGCQISEYALMTNELTACLENRSVEAYCQLK